jgi:hypothetical protein
VHRNRGPLFWVSAVVGWALIAWGVRGALLHDIDTRPAELARFLLGGALIHDLVVAPLVLFIGLGVARLVPSAWRGAVQAAAIISACAVLFAYPLVRGYGRAANNPTSLPHNYGRNLFLVVAAVWLVTVAVAAVRRWPSRRSRWPA